MAVFELNQPVVTDVPRVTVERLRPGIYRFQLVVTDDQGLQSRPDTLQVVVTPRGGPIDPLDPVRPPVGPIGPIIDPVGPIGPIDPRPVGPRPPVGPIGPVRPVRQPRRPRKRPEA